MYDKKAKLIFETMIQRSLLPETGEFLIDDKLLNMSVTIGAELFSKKSSESKRKPSDIRLHKKIAGLNFLFLLNERISEREVLQVKKSSNIKQHCGVVYVIANPAFPDYLKIGITKNLQKRLSSYQTYDPYRQFTVIKTIFVANIRNAETQLLEKFRIMDAYTGEWVPVTYKKEIFRELNNIE